ncbi:beta-galactosidase [Mariniphaga anaerophila]|uniref:Beta-galactosidase n=2 Tax=Mariniphaga anaerophila TaxID=1484053 RepID=A0A1M5A735_9BACT|nr:beta-galactosidase [Mariniphaga anaerophila]
MSGKRLFLYFEGVNSVAKVLVNGKLAGRHIGGYTAFCFEITDLIKEGEDASLTVFVSNAYRLDVVPLSGDFNIYGGIHRPVHLLVTGNNCISPLDYASSGIYVKPLKVSKEEAAFNVETVLSLNGEKQGLALKTTLLDDKQNVVESHTVGISNNNSERVRQSFSINNPILWNGKKNPYCYQVKVELLDGKEVIDKVVETTGFRYFSVDADNGFFLNGQYLDLYGFGMHEDIAEKGSAYTISDYLNDIELVKESGATVLRLTHYPHGKPIYNLSDKKGIVLWTEIPFVGPGGYTGPGYVKDAALEENARQMLVEMIRQNYNHPSIFFWGLFNELKLDFDNPVPFLKELNALAKSEDSSRMTTSATFGSGDGFIGISDLIGWNQYSGWYGGAPEQVGDFMDKMKTKAQGIPVCVSEYGAGASIYSHQSPVEQPVPVSNFHPEEWQVSCHEGNWKALSERPYIWGKFVWNFADFGSSIRNEGDRQGINDKGLITYDHKTKKDAFYFYKANWNPEPMVYIASRRFINRTQKITDVKVFANVKKVELWVNGEKIGMQNPDSFNTVIWKNIELVSGENTVEVKAKNGKQVLQDSCVWILLK